MRQVSMATHDMFTCPNGEKIDQAALECFRDQEERSRGLQAVLKKLQQELELPDVEIQYLALPNGTHLHCADCYWIEGIPATKLTGFFSREEAVEAAHTPYKTCRS
jgi:hypothetical protein